MTPTPEQIDAAPTITLDQLVRIDCGDGQWLIVRGSAILTAVRSLQEIDGYVGDMQQRIRDYQSWAAPDGR